MFLKKITGGEGRNPHRKEDGYIPIVLENMGIITKYFESKTNFCNEE